MPYRACCVVVAFNTDLDRRPLVQISRRRLNGTYTTNTRKHISAESALRLVCTISAHRSDYIFTPTVDGWIAQS
jgi:hypothetical protein